jgi:chromosome segregation ATPase
MFDRKLKQRIADLEERLDGHVKAEHLFVTDDYDRMWDVGPTLYAFNKSIQALESLELYERTAQRHTELSDQLACFKNSVSTLTDMVTALQSRVAELAERTGVWTKLADLTAIVESTEAQLTELALNLQADRIRYDAIAGGVEMQRRMLTAQAEALGKHQRDICEQGALIEGHTTELRGHAHGLEFDRRQLLNLEKDVNELVEATRCYRRAYPAIPAKPAVPEKVVIERLPGKKD